MDRITPKGALGAWPNIELVIKLNLATLMGGRGFL